MNNAILAMTIARDTTLYGIVIRSGYLYTSAQIVETLCRFNDA